MMPRATAPTAELSPLLVDASAASRLLGVGRTTFLSLVSQGRVPPSVRLGRRRLWPLDGPQGLRAWVAAGCPPFEQWALLVAEDR